MNVACIVPTRDRTDTLAQFLDSLRCASSPPHAAIRLIIVDNSRDGQVRAQLPSAFPFPIDYLHEPTPGASRARNAGLRRVHADEYACLLDDDIVVPETFFVDLDKVIAAHPFAGMIGGRVELFDELDLPLTIKIDRNIQKYHGGHGILSLLMSCCAIITPRGRATRLLFDERLGPGMFPGTAEDVDLAYRVWCATGEVVYDPTLFVFHNHGRRTLDAARRLLVTYKRGHGAFFCKHFLRGDFSMLRSGYWFYRSQIRNFSTYSPRQERSLNPNAGELPDIWMESMLLLLLDGAFRFLLVSLKAETPAVRRRSTQRA